MNKPTKQSKSLDCTLCRKLNDGLCGNYCQLSKAQVKALIEENKHLFRVNLKNSKESL